MTDRHFCQAVTTLGNRCKVPATATRNGAHLCSRHYRESRRSTLRIVLDGVPGDPVESARYWLVLFTELDGRPRLEVIDR